MLRTLSTAGLLAAALAGAPALSAAAEPPQLGLPVDCPKGRTCDVVKYLDHDPGPGLRDYACGTMIGGEDNYPGTSIAIRDMDEMRAGVAVRAAAAGTVLRIRDGVADTGIYGPESREELSAKGCGNAVVLDHGDGWTTAYCHLRQGSVRVAPGEAVRRGDPIAQIGLSGLTELPHLHFQVRHADRPVDPFTGEDRPKEACGLGSRPLWAPDALARLTPYRPVLPRLSGFATGETTLRAAREGGQTGIFPACAPKLQFWTEILGVKAGDRVTLRVVGPDARVLLDQGSTLSRGYAQIFLQAGAQRSGASWPGGDYRGTATVTRDGQSFVTESTAKPAAGGC